AGAGTGKTRVIIERLAWLVDEQGVEPRSLLAMTFTNRAADEMRVRLAERLGVRRVGAWLGTFHSFGLYVLRREIETLGRARQFTVIDDSDQLTLMKRLVKDLPGRYARVSPREALRWVSLHKQDVRTPRRDPGAPEEETCLALWDRYHTALRKSNGVDFDDLLVLTTELFQEHPDIRRRYGSRFAYVHVDEYQDTNRAQYIIARELARDHGNLFVVGDEDQSIYAWRGANIRNILDFESDFPGASVYRLEVNYRSTSTILDAANAIVANNVERLGKTLRTAREETYPVRVYEAENGEDEARFVAEDIANAGLSPRGTAVLFRTNGQSRLIEEALRRKGLAYVVIGGVSFFGRKEVKDILAYLRLMVNPADDQAVRRVVNVPPRGIGAQTMDAIEAYAAERGCSLFEVLRDAEHDQTLATRARRGMADFVRIIDDLAVQAKSVPLAKVVESLLDAIQYREYVKRGDERDFRTGLEIVEEFLSACATFDENERGGLGLFLQELALVSQVDELDPTTPAVKLLTCHSAKGLEFDNVYLIGLEEGFLPHASALESESEVEEERRLCYVAMTRARNRLALTWARSRIVFGARSERAPSRFLDEIPRNLVEQLGASRRKKRSKTAQSSARPGAELDSLKMGTRVRHAQFGTGIVMYTKGRGKKMRARIRFQSGRTREFLVSVAPLEILERKQP
ncbi:MAG: 3'-5' exonuclease, partial [Candidatus Hydrogenedentota bacterium]